MKSLKLTKEELVKHFSHAVMKYVNKELNFYEMLEECRVKKPDDWVYLVLYINKEHPIQFKFIDFDDLRLEIKEVEKKGSKYNIKVYKICSHNLYYDYILQPKEGSLI